MVCARTLYNYIRDGLFYGLGGRSAAEGEAAESHAVRPRRVALNNPTGTSIEERTAVINDRLEDGHWEMDTVAGKPGTKACLLVLTERNNLELAFKLPGKTQSCMVKLLDRLERNEPFPRRKLASACAFERFSLAPIRSDACVISTRNLHGHSGIECRCTLRKSLLPIGRSRS